MWKLQNFYVTQILREIKVNDLKCTTNAFHDFFHFLEAGMYQNENVGAPEIAKKMANFELLYSPKVISRKIGVTEKS